MTAATVIKDLSLDAIGRYIISPLDFSEIEVVLCEAVVGLPTMLRMGPSSLPSRLGSMLAAASSLKTRFTAWNILEWLIHTVFLATQISKGL